MQPIEIIVNWEKCIIEWDYKRNIPIIQTERQYKCNKLMQHWEVINKEKLLNYSLHHATNNNQSRN